MQCECNARWENKSLPDQQSRIDIQEEEKQPLEPF